jgi:hypothetical protein
LYGFELRRMRIVATDAQIVSLLSVPLACSLTMYAEPPVPELGPMTLSAKKVRVLKINWFTVTERQEIVAIVRVVAVQAPNSHTAVVQLDVSVDQESFPSLEIHGKILFRAVACAARSNGLGQRG